MRRRGGLLVFSPPQNCWWDGIKWYGPPACVENNDVNRQAVCQGWQHQISTVILIYTPLPSSLSICLFHSLSLPAKHLRPSLLFLITMATCCLKSKRSSDLGLSNSFLILTLRKCTNYRRQLTYIALWSVYICHHNQTNTCEWAAPRMQSPSPVIAGPATKFTPNISLLLSMANFHIFWQ